MLPRITWKLIWKSYSALSLLGILCCFSIADSEIECPPNHFKCHHTSMCISQAFVCDGEVDCPVDGSDEDPLECHKMQIPHEKHDCDSNQWMCEDGNCIESNWVCDGVGDCPDGSDENIKHCANKTCDGFFCKDEQKCIEKSMHCDGKIDCKDASDEISCESWILPSSKCVPNEGFFECLDSKRCIELNQLCNGQNHCIDGSDEGPGCAYDCGASCSNGMTCQRMPTGARCFCSQGYEVTIEGKCHDIDECTSEIHPALCDQECVNYPGSYKCTCKHGYKRVNETCKTEGGEGMLLFATSDEVRLLYLTSGVYDRVATNVNHSSAVTSDGEYVYWASYEYGEEAIHRATEIGTAQQLIFTAGLGMVEDIAVDWMTKNLYFTDATYKHIAVCSENAVNCMALITTDVEKPRALVLYPTEGLLFFTDWGSAPKITKAGMDGSQCVDIITSEIEWPNGLAIDHGTDRLYWIDAKIQKLYHAKFDGSDRKTIHFGTTNFHPFSLDVFEDTLYWSDLNGHEIRSCNKITGGNLKSVIRHSHGPILGIHIYHPILLGSNEKNPCLDAKCSDLCLIAPSVSNGVGYTCACPSGRELSSNQHSCTQKERTQYLIVASGSELYAINYKQMGRFEERKISNHQVLHIDSVAYNSLKDQIILTDKVSKGTVTVYDLSSEKVESVFHLDTQEVTDMDFDPLGNNLFWIDGQKKAAGVTNLNKFETAVLIRDFGGETPLSISLNSEEGIMFIALRNDDSSIYIDQFSMDGSTSSRIRRVSEDIVGPSVSLFFDSHSQRLYWSDVGAGTISSIDKEDNNSMRHATMGYSSLKDVVVIGNDIFWTVFHKSEIFWTKQDNPGVKKHTPIGEPGRETSFKLAKGGSATGMNHEGCLTDNGGCSHICLSILGKQACRCPDSLVLGNDGRTCVSRKGCDPDEFECLNDHCIPLYLRCNTFNDCSSGEDERNCSRYTCPIGTFACINGHQCIEHHLVCDSVTNCDDGSDEQNCQVPLTCSPVEFRCQSGECIHISLRCNQKYDCNDGTDESDCDDLKCKENLFTCAPGECIPLSWVCDGEFDCLDHSDEHSNCSSSRECHSNEMRCKNNHCVDHKLVCNGEDDCEDGSDEENCQTLPSNKSVETPKLHREPDEFHCSSGNSYIPISLRCDGKADCPHGEDEKGCEGCGIEEFRCESVKTCISIKWKCDGFNDCPDHSDEKDCPKKSLLYHPTGSCNGFRCKDTGFCVEWKHVCNNETDCHDGSDEGGACGSSCANSGCEVCHETPIGFHCGCPEGYHLMNDGKLCVDIDECGIPSSCSQFCQNSVGSFKCSCDEQLYHLRTDGKTCKARGPEMEYVFATDGDVRYKSSLLNNADLIFKSDHKVTVKGLDVDMNERVAYWTSEMEGVLYKCKFGDMESTEMIANIAKPGKVAFDWVSGYIYFTERDFQIRTCDFNLKKCATIIEGPKDVTIDALRIDATSRKLYWSETSQFSSQDSKGVIKSSDLSGSNIIIIQDDGIHKVIDIVVDEMKKALYYTDSLAQKVQRINLETKMASTIMFSVQGKPLDLNIFEGHLYWLSKMRSREVGSFSRDNIISKCGVSGVSYEECENIRLLPEYSSQSIHRLRISQSALQPTEINHCASKEINCAHLCISEKNGPVCICEDGVRVKPGQKCPSPIGPVALYKFTTLKKEISQANESSSPKVHESSSVWWGLLTLVSLVVLVGAGYVLYKFYSLNQQSKTEFNSVHFQNPSYELNGHTQLASYEDASLSPGQHQYENPISFKPSDDSVNNNTLKIARGEGGVWPLKETRNPEEFTHVPELKFPV